MKQRFRLVRRNGVFYAFDRLTEKRATLNTNDVGTARRLLHEKNDACEQPLLNHIIVQARLSVADPASVKRTWSDVFEEISKTKHDATRTRWERAAKDQAFNSIRDVALFKTLSEHFLRVLEHGTVSTNVFLRRAHNFALDMNWLLRPVLPKRQWPKVHYKPKRAITWDEHLRIINREGNPEKRVYYDLLWHLGGSQGDIANLAAENIDWENKLVTFYRQKLQHTEHPPVQISFGHYVEHLLKKLPTNGKLFPYLSSVRSADRATEFKQRCVGLGIQGVTLHSYRYAWAERAKAVGMPERFAMQALGHNSKAVHRAYAKKVQVKVPALEDLESQVSGKIVQLPQAVNA